MSQLIDYNSELSSNISSPSISPTSVASLLSDEMDSNISWFIDRNPDRNISRFVNNNVINYDNYNNYNNYVDLLYNEMINQPIPINNLYQEGETIDIKCEIIEVSEEDQNCCICMETREKEDICHLNCNHKFCEICINSLLNKNKKSIITPCPLCRETITTIKTQKDEIKNALNLSKNHRV